MRSVEEVREAKLYDVRSLVTRTGAWCHDGRSVQNRAASILGDLCFIDERDDEAKAVREALYVFGKLGVVGAFQAVFGEDCDYKAEVASVYAQKFAQLGYLEVENRRSELEWRSLKSSVRERYDEVDVRRSQVLADLGEASVIADKRVLCYVGHGADEWIFFDFWEPYVIGYDAHCGSFGATWSDDPLLRNIRVPAASFNESLIMTKYGKAIRWGPGWWLRKEPGQSKAPEGVQEQLLQIEHADPSQSLGPRRP